MNKLIFSKVDAAVKAAKEAFPAWSCKSPQERSQVLNKLADLIDAHREEFAQAESKDQGWNARLSTSVPGALQYYLFTGMLVLCEL